MDDLRQTFERWNPSQDFEELSVLVEELKVIQPLVILELGMDRGGSIMTWFEIFDPALLIGVDIQNPKWDIIDLAKGNGMWLIKNDTHSLKTLNEIKKRLGDDYLDFLFIDGDHSYAGVRKDFEMYAPLVKAGGIIAFHDIKVNPADYPDGAVAVANFWGELTKEIVTAARYDDWDFKEVWHEGYGTGTGIVYVGS